MIGNYWIYQNEAKNSWNIEYVIIDKKKNADAIRTAPAFMHASKAVSPEKAIY